jgi:hypothetical protein
LASICLGKGALTSADGAGAKNEGNEKKKRNKHGEELSATKCKTKDAEKYFEKKPNGPLT